MATTFVKPGHVLDFTAPTGGVTVNVPVFIGGFFVIPETTAAVGVRFSGFVTGVHALPRTASETWLEGQAAFWDATNAKVSIDPAVGLFPIGSVEVAGASADTTGVVRLSGISLNGRAFHCRRHLAVATVNAGATVLPAIPGVKYRLVDASAIAVGGAAGAVTTVDLKGTQSTSVVKLVAWAQANLTQSTQLRSGATGAAILADGASYAPCDVNTAITVGITGSSITTATFIDFLLTISLE